MKIRQATFDAARLAIADAKWDGPHGDASNTGLRAVAAAILCLAEALAGDVEAK